MTHKVVMIGGPNLGRLGTREPDIYGDTTWAQLEALCLGWAEELEIDLDFLQMLQQQNWIAAGVEQHAVPAEIDHGGKPPRPPQVFPRRRVVEHHTNLQFRLTTTSVRLCGADTSRGKA